MKFFSSSAFLVCLAASPAAAYVVVDQEYVGPSASAYSLDYPGDYMAQTFTARNTGQIVSIALQVSFHTFFGQPTPATDNLHFKLTQTNAVSEPVLSNVLAAYDVGPQDLTTDFAGIPMVEIDLRNQHVEVEAGDVLAMVVTSNYTAYSHSEHQNYDWNFSGYFDQIAGGKFFVYSPQVFSPRWFYQWNNTDPTLTGDAGYRITIDTVPEPSSVFLGVLGTLIFIGLSHRGPRTVGSR
jgi:hypothetical protein